MTALSVRDRGHVRTNNEEVETTHNLILILGIQHNRGHKFVINPKFSRLNQLR